MASLANASAESCATDPRRRTKPRRAGRSRSRPAARSRLRGRRLHPPYPPRPSRCHDGARAPPIDWLQADASVLTKYALLLAQTGQSDAAVVLAQRAQALDPLRPDECCGSTAALLLRAGRYNEAIRTAREALKRLPGDSEATA